jgi:ATP-binding cassette, subfamily C, bacterial
MTAKGVVGLVLYFMRAHPWRSALTVAYLIAAGLVEGMSLAMFLPLVELATGGATPSALGGTVRDALTAIGLRPTLGVLLGVVVAGMTLKGVFLWFALNQVGYTVARTSAELRLTLIDALLHARWEHFTGQPVGHYANAISREATVAAMAYRNAALAIAAAVQLCVYAAVAFLVSWRTAALALGAGALIAVLLYRLITLSRLAGRRQTELIKSLIARLVDALNGIKPIKAMNCERHLLPLLEAETHGLNDAQRLSVLASQSLATFQEPISVFVLAVGLYVTMRFLGEPFSALLIMAFLFSRLVNQVNVLFRYYQAMLTGESGFWSLWHCIEESRAACEPAAGRAAPPPLREAITLDNVHFAYGDAPVLRGVSMTVPSGRFVAIEGPSGSGKTTLIDLVIGLLEPGAGDIRIDGVALNTLDRAAWRAMIGYVPQEMFLFHDTIYSNITLGDGGLTRTDAQAALRAAGAGDFVSALPDGIDTVVGERGSKLSGGQRQRIALARALVRNPRLLILDEVTTALDPRTEADICATLAGLTGAVTILAVSHQPAIVAVADRVYRLSNGTAIQCPMTNAQCPMPNAQ